MRSGPDRSATAREPAVPNTDARRPNRPNVVSSRFVRSTPLTSAASAAPVGITSSAFEALRSGAFDCTLSVIFASLAFCMTRAITPVLIPQRGALDYSLSQQAHCDPHSGLVLDALITLAHFTT